MKTTTNTVLITGGSAGIGFEMAKIFLNNKNTVIITGRDKARLEAALTKLPGATGIVSDVTSARDVSELVEKIKTDFPALNIVINNAGRAILHNLSDGNNAYDFASQEIITNYLSILKLNELLIPILKTQPDSAIVQVSSIVAFVPSHRMSTYSASKAALHSYTQSLRLALTENTSIKVFEVMPPLVNTDFSREIGGEKGIPPHAVAEEFWNAFKTDQYEVHVGQTAFMYELSRKAPLEALAAMNPTH